MRARQRGLLLYVGSTTRAVWSTRSRARTRRARPPWTPWLRPRGTKSPGSGIEVAIVVPGAITSGTAHFSEGTRPADIATAQAYARLEGLEQHIMDRLAELSPPGATPRAVADEIARVVSLPHGECPLRTAVDFLHDGAEQVDAVAERLQASLMDRLGIADLLHPATPPLYAHR
jgi:hypothetical protein